MDNMNSSSDNLLPGSTFRATHQASVDAILQPINMKRKVMSQGTDFLNKDNWPLRFLAGAFCEWKLKNPGQIIKSSDILELVQAANKKMVEEPCIIIAETPEHLPVKVATAFMGAAYHEAWHTKYSLRKNLNENFVKEILVPRQNRADWAKLGKSLLSWMNLVDDIYIEKFGCQDFIGAQSRMENIADFVIEKEKEILKDNLTHGGKDSPLSVAMGLFRELGKGYVTDIIKENINECKKRNYVVYQLVTLGSISKLLEKVKNLKKEENWASLPIAMDIIIEISSLAEDMDKAEEEAKTTSGNGKLSGHDVQQEAGKLLKELASKKEDSILDIAGAIKDTLRGMYGPKTPKNGRYIFRPYSTSEDKVVYVNSRDNFSINGLLSSVRAQTNYLRTRLRHLFKASELVDVEHGVKHGLHVSDRMVAESVCSIRNDVSPERAFYTATEAPDLSMSAVIVVDESGSMNDKLSETTRILLCLTESLDSIGCKTMVAGFMDDGFRDFNRDIQSDSEDFYHRFHPVIYHVFKMFHEKFQYIKGRFGNISAKEGTPMGDGINFALNVLSSRNEGHRFIFVVTDGQPDDHGPVRNRLDAAQSAGIKVVGIGLGFDASYVVDCFPDSVYAESLEDIPPLLVKKVTSIAEKTERFRGRKVSKDLSAPSW